MIISKKKPCTFSGLHVSSHMKDTVDEPTEAPTAITLNKSRLKDVVDEDGDGGSSLNIDLTLINSTFNYTETQEVRMRHITLPDH